MDSSSHLHNTILQTIHVITSTIKFVNQILAPLLGSCLFLWKLIFCLNWFYFSTSYFLSAIFVYLYLFLCWSHKKIKNKKERCLMFFLNLLQNLEKSVPVSAIDRTSTMLEHTHAYHSKELVHLRSTFPQLRTSAHLVCICARSQITYAWAHSHSKQNYHSIQCTCAWQTPA